jgi:hypothetical protein
MADVAKEIGGSNKTVYQNVVDDLTRAEVIRRTGILSSSLKQLGVVQKEVKSVQPDALTFDETGAQTSAGFTRQQLQKLQKAKQKFEKLDKAITEAINNGKYDDLEKVMKECQPQEKPQQNQPNA